MSLRRSFTLFGLTALFFVASEKSAYAYLDPSTGSYVIQIIIGSIVAIGAAIKLYWTKLKNIFKKAK